MHRIPTLGGGHRRRWMAIGAVTALTLAPAGLASTSASIGSGERGVYVPITPCRMIDTRAGADNVGPRSTPIGPNEVHVTGVRGTNGNCTIPVDAVGVVMNVAVVNPTAASFLTVYPADAARPLAANVNWTAGQPPVSNAVTADIAADGSIAFFNLAGTVDIAADIVGYFVDHTHDDRYPTEAEVDAAVAAQPSTSASRVAVDSLGNVGSFTAIAIGVDGNPVIAYADMAANDLKVAKCATPTCTGLATITTLDSAGVVGGDTSIAIGRSGNPIVAYRDVTNADVKIAACSNPACTVAVIAALDSTGVVGDFTSIAIGEDGNPIVAYHDATNTALKVAACTDPTCAAPATITAVDSVGDVGYFTSVAIGADSLPVISYFDNGNGDLKVAKCTARDCTGIATLTPLDSTVAIAGFYTSIAIAPSGAPVVAYRDNSSGDLKFAACDHPACSGSSTISAIDSVGDVGYFVALRVPDDGAPVIAYFDFTNNDLKVAKCASATCAGTPSITIVESDGQVGAYTSLAIGSDGLPIVAHTDIGNLDLRVAKCASATCTP